MTELVKVAHTRKVNTQVISSYGMIHIDQYGCAEVPPEMAKKIEDGDYGETWRLLNGKAKKKEPMKAVIAHTDNSIAEVEVAAPEDDVADFEEAPVPVTRKKKKATKKKPVTVARRKTKSRRAN